MKFVSLVNSANGMALYALTECGRFFRYDAAERIWEELRSIK